MDLCLREITRRLSARYEPNPQIVLHHRHATFTNIAIFPALLRRVEPISAAFVIRLSSASTKLCHHKVSLFL
jgi:hypothetical protein